MRDFKGMKRQRGRNRKSGGGQNQNAANPNRSWDSQGPENIKVRGNAQTVYERYQQLARDASSGGDRVLAENYHQHAEHYFRVLRALQPQRSVQDIAARENFTQGFDIDFEDESGAQAAAFLAAQQAAERQAQEQAERAERRDEGQRAERQDRNDRNDRQDRDDGQDGEQREGGRRESRRERWERRRAENRARWEGREGEEREGSDDEPRSASADASEPAGDETLAREDKAGDDMGLPGFLTRPAAPAAEAPSEDAPEPNPARRRAPRKKAEAPEGEG